MKKQNIIEKLFSKKHAESVKKEFELSVEKQDMIRGIVELSDKTVKEVMVPRIDCVFVAADMEAPGLIDKISSSGHSRFPVYKDSSDNIVGMLYAKDLLPYLFRGDAIDVSSIARKTYFVPESKKLDSLLREMKRKRVHIAVAVDEYGGVSGLVALEDIIEEIVGDIQDEYDNEREDILEVSKGVYLCDARVDIEDLNEKLQVHIPEENFDTLGGFVFDLFGRIPVKYEKTSYGPLDFVIQDVDGHKIRTVKIVVTERES